MVGKQIEIIIREIIINNIKKVKMKNTDDDKSKQR